MRLNFKFLQTDGVPLTADLMDDIQQAYSIFNVLGDIAGNLTILSGCEMQGSLVTPGIVVINGDVLYFEGGTVYSTVFITQEDITKVFKNQQAKVLIEKKTVKFGDASVTYNWTDFVRIQTLRSIKESLATKAELATVINLVERVMILEKKTAPIKPGGTVWPWRVSLGEIPVGWKECTDFRGKTLVGVDPADPDFGTIMAEFGTKKHKLLESEMPIHVHGIAEYAGSPGMNNNHLSASTNGGASPRTTPAGGDQPHNNVQPSKMVYFIEYIG